MSGGLAEWSNAPVLKTGVRESVPWVRIPRPPPLALPSHSSSFPYVAFFLIVKYPILFPCRSTPFRLVPGNNVVTIVGIICMSGKLTAQGVKNLKEPGKYSDGGGLGLFLWVKPNGGRFWIQRIVINGRRREIGMGGYPIVSLASAREQALINKQFVRQGGDPLAEKRKAKGSVTFKNAAERFLETKLNGYRNAKHRAQWCSTLRTYAYPVLGHLDVNTIEPRDVLRAVQPIWETKTETAKRVRGRIEAVLSWATVAGHRAGDNPARWRGNLSEMLPSPSKVAKSEHYPAVTLGDAPRWFRALQDQTGFGARALELLALTGGRSGDARGMLWEEIQVLNPDGALAPLELESLETANAETLVGAVWVTEYERVQTR